MKRRVVNVQTPSAQPGFLGRGHTARPVITVGYRESDPFIVLMDDVLDKRDSEPAGGPHPHAGFETVSLLLEGEMGDGADKLYAGDFQIMTAGSGVIHTETIEKETRMRLLQMWLTLPRDERWAEPRLQTLRADHAPTLANDGMRIRLYSGSLAGLHSPVVNHVPVIIADVTLEANVNGVLTIPAAYSTFLYVLRGSALVGADQNSVLHDQVAWLDRIPVDGDSELELKAGAEGVRFVLYSGEPQGDPIVAHGPFVGDSQDDIRRLYREFREGRMRHILEMSDSVREV